MFKKNTVKPIEIDWSSENKKSGGNSGNFEDIMSRFLKDSEERMQDVKKNQDFKAKSGRRSF